MQYQGLRRIKLIFFFHLLSFEIVHLEESTGRWHKKSKIEVLSFENLNKDYHESLKWPHLRNSECFVSFLTRAGLLCQWFGCYSSRFSYFSIVLDHDECKTTSHGCQQKCVNEYGRYFCACTHGYHLNSDNRTCSG